MTRILMVCLGNICRSPLAEEILRMKLKSSSLTEVSVDSAGTSEYHIGEHPDKRSTANARNHGVDISRHLGRQFQKNDFDKYDFIYVMDSSNYTDVMAQARSEADKAKVGLLLNELHPGKNESVPDPYFGGEEGFELVFKLLDESCTCIINKLLTES
jgi:protein-tyrosine phosphatase